MKSIPKIFPRLSLFILFILETVGSQAHAFAPTVLFDNGLFFDPFEYLNLPQTKHRSELTQAFDSTVLIGGRATAVMISPNGVMLTAFHTIRDLYVGPTDNCQKLNFFMAHRHESDGRTDSHLRRFQCAKILFTDYGSDFAVIQAKLPSGETVPYAEIEIKESEIAIGMTGVLSGHRKGGTFPDSYQRISSGEVIQYYPHHEELPHFLHLIDTEGGDSGAPVFNTQGKLIGIHFRGIPNYGHDIPVVIGGKPELTHRFNVAIPLPYLVEKFGKEFLLNP